MKPQFLFPLFLVCLSLLLTQSTAMTVSKDSFFQFWQHAYDRNADGKCTIQQFLTYFQAMQPEWNLTKQDIKGVFSGFDTDGDDSITPYELLATAQVGLVAKSGPKQLHIGLTAHDNQMQIMWVTQPEKYSQPVVMYGLYPTVLNMVEPAETSTYNVGHVGFHGTIYHAVMRNLTPKRRYYYVVGDQLTKVFSEVKEFNSPPKRHEQQPQLVFAVFGDMGTFAPMGHHIIKQIARDQRVKPFDLVFLTGDIAYAGIGPQSQGEFQPIWDLFGQMTEIFAAYVPFMPGVGNHQKYYGYESYQHRYVLPRQFPGQTNFWFSFDYGQVHFIHMSSEHPYQIGSEQYGFLESDLKAARANPEIKWIIFGVHRPFYSSDKSQYSNVTSLALHLEDLLNQYHVDIVQTGHQHCYERTWPLYKGHAMKQNQTHSKMINPKAPIYIVQGTAGALVRESWLKPKPEWSLKRTQKYGYGRMIVKGNQIKYQFITVPFGRIVDEWTLTKDGKGVDWTSNQQYQSQQPIVHEEPNVQ